MTFDVIVVGAGTAGCVLATRLSENADRRVALVEAGSDYPLFHDLPDDVKYLGDGPAVLRGALGGDARRRDWGFVATTGSGPAFRLPRGKVVGGTGSINGRVFLRGFRRDFDEWVAAGNPEWSFEKVLPYFCKQETDLDFHDDFHGKAGPIRVSRVLRHDWSLEDQAFEEACRSLGFPTCDDLNAPHATNVGPTPSSSQDGTRMSSARAYLTMARGRANLTIIPDTTVHRLVFNGVKVRGIQTVSGDMIEAPEVILAGGTLKSPHLLMLSGVGPADQLRSVGVSPLVDLPGVGQDLRDHPNIVLMWRRGLDAPAREPARAQVGVQGLAAGLRLSFTAEGSEIADDCMIRSFGSTTMEGAAEGTAGARMALALSQATSTGTMRLESSDPTVLPSIDLRYLTTEDDRSRMRYAVEFGIELAAQSAIRRFVDAMVQPGPEDLADATAFQSWMLRRLSTGHHLTSTCRMGPDTDERAVVDQYGRVRGLDGVRVADASIMPKCIRPNTQATIMMIGERIADFVKEQSR